MKSIAELILKFVSKEKHIPKSLGRWNLDYCNKKINRKIDLANEDHCGPCGKNVIEEITIKKIK
jgi:hypothetical protein